MGWRFQKRIRLMPGITLNLSKKGVSTSLGTRGARVTLGHDQRRTTLGLPGSGISHTEVVSTKRGRQKSSYTPRAAAGPQRKRLIKLALIAGLIFLMALVFGASRAWAINKCTGPDGKVSFQDSPCAVGSASAREDMADAKNEARSRPDAAVQSGKAVAAHLQAQLEVELKKQANRPAQPIQAGDTPTVTSSSTSMSFRQCNSTVAATVSSLGVNWKDVRRIVNSADMSMTKICTSDGSVTITCSEPDSKMVTTRGASC